MLDGFKDLLPSGLVMMHHFGGERHTGRGRHDHILEGQVGLTEIFPHSCSAKDLRVSALAEDDEHDTVRTGTEGLETVHVDIPGVIKTCIRGIILLSSTCSDKR